MSTLQSDVKSHIIAEKEGCDTASCTLCCSALERVRYFPRQLITAEDMRTAHEYLYEKMRRHNRFLHGWGVVCGCSVEHPGGDDPNWQVTICPGYVVTPQGDEINLCEPVKFDLKTGAQKPPPCTVQWTCPPEGTMPSTQERSIVYLAVRFAECLSRQVRVHPAGCGCDETNCEYSRIRDSFEFKLLWQLPESHIRAKKIDDKWCQIWKNRLQGKRASKDLTLPLPPCPECTDDPWVVLANIQLPAHESTKLLSHDITYANRRILYSGNVMQAFLMCT